VSVISCRLIGEKRSGEKATNLVRTYTQAFRVETNSKLDGPAVVLATHSVSGHPQLPIQLYTSYTSGNDSDPEALCISVNADEEGESMRSWIVTAQFSTAPPGNPEQFSTNPLNDAALYSLGFDQFQSLALFENDGTTPVVTKNGEWYDPPPEKDDSRPVYMVRRNESYISLPFIIYAKDSVNASAWKGCAPRTVKLKNITTGEIQQRNQFSYYTVTYEFHLNPDTWDLRVLHRGRWIYSPTISEVVDVQEPVLLDETGEIIPPGSDVEPYYRTHRVYRAPDFNSFGL